jgi:oxalate decarboxylase
MEKSSQEYSDEMNQAPQPIRGDRGAPIMGPRNLPLERENPDLLASPYTDSGTIPNLKFSFATMRCGGPSATRMRNGRSEAL